MKIYGPDFTSSPSPSKPITCAECILQNDELRVSSFTPLTSFDDYEVFLEVDGPWVAGIDFPFGQPWKLIVTAPCGDVAPPVIAMADGDALLALGRPPQEDRGNFKARVRMRITSGKLWVE